MLVIHIDYTSMLTISKGTKRIILLQMYLFCFQGKMYKIASIKSKGSLEPDLKSGKDKITTLIS